MFGNLTLFLALASLSLAAFSLGSVWATAENGRVTESVDDEGELDELTVCNVNGGL